MTIAYRLAIFDRQTEGLVDSVVIPQKFSAVIREIAKIPASDDGAGDYPLNATQVKAVAEKLGIRALPDEADYFLEPYWSETSAEREIAAER